MHKTSLSTSRNTCELVDIHAFLRRGIMFRTSELPAHTVRSRSKKHSLLGTRDLPESDPCKRTYLNNTTFDELVVDLESLPINNHATLHAMCWHATTLFLNAQYLSLGDLSVPDAFVNALMPNVHSLTYMTYCML